MEPMNVAPTQAAQAFEIIPSQGETILLHGWLRGYAEFDVQWRQDEPPLPNAIDSRRVRQEVFEASNGHWLLVETIVESNVAQVNARECFCWHFEDKASIRARFRYRTHTRALFEHVGLPYQVVIGGEA